MMGFRHLSIGRKLGVSFGIIGLLVVVLAAGVGVSLRPNTAGVTANPQVLLPELSGQIVKTDLQTGGTIDVTPAGKEWLAQTGFDPVYGARPLKRLVQTTIAKMATMTPNDASVGTSGTAGQMVCAQCSTSLPPMKPKMAASP